MKNNINNIDIIKWAFEKGYLLGQTNMKEGAHIDFPEIKKHFIYELSEYYPRQELENRCSNNIYDFPTVFD